LRGVRVGSAPAGRLAAALGGCLVLGACISDDPEPPRPLFKAPAGGQVGGVAPGPHAVWYAPAEPVRFVKIGVATWAEPRARPGWLGRLFQREAPAVAEPAAIAAAGLALPTPSRVQVTNVATGRTITLRVEDQDRLGADVILKLPAAAAQDLGADPHQALLVRVRYLAPLLAYGGRPALRSALRGPLRAPAPPPIMLAAAAPAPAIALPAPPAPLAVPSPTSPTAPAPPAAVAQALRGALAAGVVRVQVGAFASIANAERAAGRLGLSGAAEIEPLRRGGLTLYRVVVTGPAGAGAAERLRARIAQSGFPDARPL